MDSFFKLAASIETASYRSTASHDNTKHYDDEDDDYYWQLRSKSFDELVDMAKARSQRFFWQPYASALRQILDTNTPFNPNEQDPENGCTILNHIVLTGELELVQALVDTGANVNIVRKDGGFALLYAALHGLQHIFNYLEPLTLPALRKTAQQSLPEGLQSKARAENTVTEAFTTAALCGNEAAIAQAIAQSNDQSNNQTITLELNALDTAGESALHKAIRGNHPNVVKQLINGGAALELTEEKYGCPPLMFAIRHAGKDVIQLLLAAGANVNHSNASRFTPLMYTVLFQQDPDLLNQLLQLGAQPQAQNDGGKTAYTLAQQWTEQETDEQKGKQRTSQSANHQLTATANILRIQSALNLQLLALLATV